MKLTQLAPLIAAAILLAATAPSASAVCVASKTCAAVNVKGVNNATGEVTGTAIAVIGVVLSLAEDLAADEDADSFPDVAEAAICGNDLLYGLANQDAVPGHCASRTDYLPPDVIAEVMAVVWFVYGVAMDAVGDLKEAGEDLAEEVERIAWDLIGTGIDTVNQVYRAVDADNDGVADALEPLVCGFVENQNLPQDGSCSEDNMDYTPPAL